MISNANLKEGYVIEGKIHTIRGVLVMLDRDLADLYGVETRVLKQAVNRNKNRFPGDFMFVLDLHEVDILVSQSVIPSKPAKDREIFRLVQSDGNLPA